MSAVIFSFPGLAARSSGFLPRLVDVATALETDPNFLLTVMQIESGINPQARNPSGGATGLIQFMPDTARDLGTTTDALRRMSDEEQLEYVLRYYAAYRGRLRSAGDCYMATFYPAKLGSPDSEVISTEGHRVYDQNAGLDVDHDGRLTVGDVKSKAEAAYRRYAGLPPLPARASRRPFWGAALSVLAVTGLIFWKTVKGRKHS
jgi:hypothetical protein